MDDSVSKLDQAAKQSEQFGDEGGIVGAFAGYRNLKRRFASAAQRGIMIPFFQPRDGISGSTIRWQGQELINYSGYNYLGLSGHPEIGRAHV